MPVIDDRLLLTTLALRRWAQSSRGLAPTSIGAVALRRSTRSLLRSQAIEVGSHAGRAPARPIASDRIVVSRYS